MPSQIARIVWFWGKLTVNAPPAPVENVKLNAPDVLLRNEYNCTVGGRMIVQFDVKVPVYS